MNKKQLPFLHAAVEWGDYVGAGSTEPRYVTLEAAAKVQAPGSCIVAAEYICSRLAGLVGLPVPPAGITLTDDGQLAFFSIWFGSRRVQPPHVHPRTLVAKHESFSAGVLTFDAWVLNDDRHDEGLAVDHGQPIAFDHSHALGADGDASRLPAINGPVDRQLQYHVVAEHMISTKPLQPWAARIRAVTDHMIEPVVEHCHTVGALSNEEAVAVFRLLCERRWLVLDALKIVMKNANDWPMEVTK